MWMDSSEDLWEDFAYYIKKLKNMILKIQKKEKQEPSDEFTKAEYSECNVLVYNMSFEHSDIVVITTRLQEIFRNFIKENIFKKLLDLQNDLRYLLEELIKCWESYDLLRRWLSRFFLHYNKMTEVHHNKKNHSNNLSLEEFKINVFAQFRIKIVDAFIFQLGEIRNDGVNANIFKENLKKVLVIFELIYAEGSADRTPIFNKLRDRLIEVNEEYYQSKINNNYDQQDCDEYFKNCEELINFEEDIFNEILEGNYGLGFIGKDIRILLFDKLLNNYRNTFCQSETGFEHFIISKNYNGLKRMRRLYQKFDNKYDIIKEGYHDIVVKLLMAQIEQFKNMIKNEQDEKKKADLKKNPTLITKLIGVYKEQDKIIQECFNKHFDFRVMVIKAQEKCLNLKDLPFSMPFLVALHTSDTLKKANKSNSDSDLIQLFDAIVVFQSCLEEKDRYLYHLAKFISKRLLDQDLDSLNLLEWDRYLVQVMKAKLGSEFTKNFEAMIQDVQNCFEKRQDFRDYLEVTKQIFPACNINVLSRCEWLIPVDLKFKVPPLIEILQNTFTKFYKGISTNLNKNLDWVYYYGTMDIKFNIPDSAKTHFVVMKPYQYFVQQLFEESLSLTYKQIIDGLQVINQDDFSKIMDSLIKGRYQILVKEGEKKLQENGKNNSKKSEEDDESKMMEEKKVDEGNKAYQYDQVWTINKDFKCKLKRFTLKEAKFTESQKDPSSIDAERKVAIESCVVRVMKSRKVLKYQELINDVMKLLLKFSPDSKDIKKQIESLIKRDYLERDPDDMNSQRYIA